MFLICSFDFKSILTETFFNGFAENFSVFNGQTYSNKLLSDSGDDRGGTSGDHSAKAVSNTGDYPDALVKSISTSGKNNITLDFWYKACDKNCGWGWCSPTYNQLEDGDYVKVQWTINGTWNDLLILDSNVDDGQWHQSTSTIIGAANNANFKLRFLANLRGDNNTDVVYIDDVSISGCNFVCSEGTTRQCGPTTDIGECAYGTQTCSGNAWGSCSGAVYPNTEICDGKDNDCDGSTDGGLS